MPPAVALLNYLSCGILWRIFCQTGIFAGFSLYIKLAINQLIKFKKLRDIIEGPWLQKDIKLPMSLFGPYRSHFLSRKSLIAAKNETKEERRKIGERDTTSACE